MSVCIVVRWRDTNQNFAPSWGMRYRWMCCVCKHVCAGYVGGVPMLLADFQTYMNLSHDHFFPIQYINNSLDTTKSQWLGLVIWHILKRASVRTPASTRTLLEVLTIYGYPVVPPIKLINFCHVRGIKSNTWIVATPHICGPQFCWTVGSNSLSA